MIGEKKEGVGLGRLAVAYTEKVEEEEEEEEEEILKKKMHRTRGSKMFTHGECDRV